MKYIIIAALLCITIAGPHEDCVKQKCPTEYNQCVAEVFGCAVIGLKCKNKCGEDDDACYQQCAYESGNKKMIAIYECGKAECSDVKSQQDECPINECSNTFNNECLTETSFLQGTFCAVNFFKLHPECECIQAMLV